MQKNKIKNIIILLIISYIIYNERKISILFEKYYSIINEPKISVIIPIYNGGQYLNYSLKSIENQKMKDIEIIIVDDHSTDDSLEIIKKYMKKDKRIKLIENQKNRRILFCKSLGALNSKGKYIIELDQDDMFIRNDAFNIIYKLGENENLDLLHFNHIAGKNVFHLPIIFNSRKKYSIEKQPELKSSLFKKNSNLLWGYLIKTNLYKKVIYNLWPIIINYKIIFQEDFLITFFMLIYAQKFLNIKNRLFFYRLHRNSASNEFRNNPEYYLSVIFAGIIFYEYYIDFYFEDFQIIINYIYSTKNDFKIIQILYQPLFNYFFGKILSNKQILPQDKNYIMNFFNITENCDSYILFNKKEIITLYESQLEKINIPKKQNQSKLFSIIVVFSNCQKIIRLINSIYSQLFESYEIILIYDDENNKNYCLIDNYINNYKNIQLVKNDMKKGILCSIIEGVLMAKGKYLMILNQNYFFLSNEDFKNINEEIEKYTFDILEFNLYKILPNYYIDLYKCKHFKSKFDLSRIKFDLDYNNIDTKNDLLTNKLFKADYFKSIIKKFNLDKINQINDYYYNNIFMFIIEMTSYSFKQISSASIFINDEDCEKIKFNNFTIEESKLIKETIFYINFIFENSENSFEIKEKVLKEYFNVLSIIFNKFTKVSKLAHKLIDKFFDCKYISKDNKNLLTIYFQSLII